MDWNRVKRNKIYLQQALLEGKEKVKVDTEFALELITRLEQLRDEVTKYQLRELSGKKVYRPEGGWSDGGSVSQGEKRESSKSKFWDSIKTLFTK